MNPAAAQIADRDEGREDACYPAGFRDTGFSGACRGRVLFLGLAMRPMPRKHPAQAFPSGAGIPSAVQGRALFPVTASCIRTAYYGTGRPGPRGCCNLVSSLWGPPRQNTFSGVLMPNITLEAYA